MAEFLFSSHWYRVANLHPRLRSHVRVTRQYYREQLWFVLQDQTSGRHHRVNQTAYQFVGRLDGTRSVQQVWDAVVETLGDEAPTQDEAIQILCQLNDNDLLQCEVTPDVTELFRRRDERGATRIRAMINPLAFRAPLIDPTRFLNRLTPIFRPLFHPVAFVLWLGVVLFASFLAVSNWPAIRAHAGVQMLSPHYLLLLWLCYPAIKAIHELGHALAVRVWGGQVNEMGITLFLLVPVPYVDASASAAFRSKYQRMAVGAMGIMVELLLAAIALLVWLNVADGLTRDIAFVTMVVGGVSTVMFNGNPLLKFDGYYVFSDAFDLPNLAQRSQAYVHYLMQRYLLRIKSLTSPAATKSESAWLLGYGIISWAYRMMITFFIVLWLASKSALLGLAAGGWLAFSLLVKPLALAINFLLKSPRLVAKRVRAGAIAAGVSAAVLVLLWFVPMPLSTSANGVVWLPEQARLHAATNGFVDKIFVSDGQAVKRGDPLLEMSDAELKAQEKELIAKLAVLEVSYQDAMGTNPARAQSFADEQQRLRGDLKEVEHRLATLLVRSPADGKVSMPHPQDMLGSFVNKGAVLAYVLSPDKMTVRVAVPQDDVALIRSNTRRANVSLQEIAGKVFSAVIAREVPAATNELPSAALAETAGGAFATDPADRKSLRTLEPVFLFDLDVPEQAVVRVGGRVRARFDHGYEPLVARFKRSLQRLMLQHFSDEK